MDKMHFSCDAWFAVRMAPVFVSPCVSATVLQTSIRPSLGIPAPLHAAMMAWVHFRQYVVTQAPNVLAETRGLLYKLASITLEEAEHTAAR